VHGAAIAAAAAHPVAWGRAAHAAWTRAAFAVWAARLAATFALGGQLAVPCGTAAGLLLLTALGDGLVLRSPLDEVRT
jgi:hypothetical protein